MQKKGVDISEHNGSVDFQALKNAGVQFAILRLGYGSDYVSQDDSRFSENVRKAETAGMPWGAYLYSYAKTAAMAQSEAQHALRLLNGKKPAYGVWFDVEDSQIANADLAATCQTFCGAMEAAGVYAGIYASLSWLNGKLNSPLLDKYDKWVAQWNSICTYKKPYGIWQYTDKLLVSGKNFDGNWAYKDYPSIIKAMSEPEKEEPDLTEAEAKKIARQEIEAYFAEQAKKPVASWAEAHVKTVQERGIMNGDEEGGFRPYSPVTRQELAATVVNTLGIGKEPSDWAEEAFQAVTQQGLLDGTMPQEMLTREQFAVVLQKLVPLLLEQLLPLLQEKLKQA